MSDVAIPQQSSSMLKKNGMSESKGKSEKSSSNVTTNQRKFSEKSSPTKKRKSSKQKNKQSSPNKNDKKETNQRESGMGKNQSDVSLCSFSPDVLRWENVCEDSMDEMRRIQVYKANRRQRYVNSNNTKIAMLAVKEQRK